MTSYSLKKERIRLSLSMVYKHQMCKNTKITIHISTVYSF